MIKFMFSDPVDVDGTIMYRMINVVPRQFETVYGKRQIINARAEGGYVEHPELLDPEQDIWLYTDSRIYGNTKINVQHSCVIRKAVLTDCDIEADNARIGQPNDSDLENYTPQDLVLSKHRDLTKMTNTVARCADLIVDHSAIIENSFLKGDVRVNAVGVISGSFLYDCHVLGHAQVIMTSAENTVFKDYAGVFGSDLIDCYIKKHAEVYNLRLENINYPPRGGSSTFRKTGSIPIGDMQVHINNLIAGESA